MGYLVTLHFQPRHSPYSLQVLATSLTIWFIGARHLIHYVM